MPVTNPGKLADARKPTFVPAGSTLEFPRLRTRIKHKLPQAIVFLEGNR